MPIQEIKIMKTFFDVEYEDFIQNLGLNLGDILPHLNNLLNISKPRHGNIINISSIYGWFPKFELYDNTSMTMPVEYAAIKIRAYSS